MTNTIMEPELIVSAYSQGYFPMYDPEDDEIYWHNPDPRAIFPFRELKIKRSLRQQLRKVNFEYKVNENYEQVIRRCAARQDTWISESIIQTYINLNEIGLSHSVETYLDGNLVGGLYGVHLGGGFFGESMFSDISGASKAAFYFLIEILKSRDFVLLDSQYSNPHTLMLGAEDIPRPKYYELLGKALNRPCRFHL